MIETLARDDAHVFYVRTETVSAEVLARCETLLDDDESARRRRFAFPEGRLQFLLGRALLRTSLSRFAHVRPTEWTFRTNPWGRPELAAPLGAPPLRFNLSHTHGLAACIVSMGREVGVDVEDTGRGGHLLEIAHRYFSPAEIAELRARPEERQRDRFFDYWTLKESYIKARGMGLSLSLRGFSLHLETPSAIQLTADTEVDAEPARWQFALWSLDASHRLAACVERHPTTSVNLHLRPTIPFA